MRGGAEVESEMSPVNLQALEELCCHKSTSLLSSEPPEVPMKQRLTLSDLEGMSKNDSVEPQWAVNVTKSLQRMEAKMEALERSLADVVGSTIREHLQQPASPSLQRVHTPRTMAPVLGPVVDDPADDCDVCRSPDGFCAASVVANSNSRPCAKYSESNKSMPSPMSSPPTSPRRTQGTPTASGEEQAWPANIERRKEFFNGSRLRNQVTVMQLLATRHTTTDNSDEEEDRDAGRWEFLMLDPESPKHKMHLRLVALAMIFDLIVMPYVVAWEVPFAGVLEVCGWLSAMIWSVDLVLGFFTGTYHEGELDLRFGRIALRYLRSLFLPNVVAVVCDILSLSLAISQGYRYLLRIVGVLRLYRLQGLSDGLLYRSLTEHGRMLFQGAKIVLAILWMNHVLCCTWYFIGRHAPTDTGGSWFETVAQIDAEGSVTDFQSLGSLYHYFTAFHWTFSQLTAGGLERLAPVNTVERLFNIFCLIFGLLFMSSLVSLLSATMTQFFMQRQDQVQKLRELRQFLLQKAVTPKMALRVQRQVAERLNKKKKLTDKDVPALAMLSSNLRSELHYEILQPQIMKHPLLRLCDGVDLETVQSLCGEGIDFRLLSPGDNLFEFGQQADEGMYFVSSGKLRYTLKSVYTRHHMDIQETVGEHSWLCEVALWTRWSHTGTAQAVMPCELLVFPAEKTLSLLFKHATIKDLVSEYSWHFHQRVVTAAAPFVPPPTDLRVPFTEYSDIVSSMDREMQAMIGEIALHEAVAKGTIEQKNMARLMGEVQDGSALAIINGHGEAELVLGFSALRLDRSEDGYMLVQLGFEDGDGAVVPLVQLPTTKQCRGEMPIVAIKRLIAELEQLVQGVGVFDHHRDSKWQGSTFGLPTRCIKTTFVANLESAAAVAAEPVKHLGTSAVTSLEREGSGAQLPIERQPSSMQFLHSEASDLACAHEVWKITEGGLRGSLYTWLPEQDFERLSEEEDGMEVVENWLQQLEGVDVIGATSNGTALRGLFTKRTSSMATFSGSSRIFANRTRSSERMLSRRSQSLNLGEALGVSSLLRSGRRSVMNPAASAGSAGVVSPDIAVEDTRSSTSSEPPARIGSNHRSVHFGPVLPSVNSLNLPGSTGSRP